MKNTILLIALSSALFAQSEPEPLLVTRVFNITSTPSACVVSSQCVDNRSVVRQNTYHSFSVTGSGAWSVTMEYASVATGPWTSFGAQAVVTQASNPPIGFGNGYQAFIRFNITGTVNVSYSAAKNFFLSNSAGGLTFPVTVAQGGSGATSLTGVLVGSTTSAFTGIAASSQLQFLRRKPNVAAVTYEFAAQHTLSATDYNWSYTNGDATVSVDLSAAGAKSATFTPCPLGVAGTNTSHYIYISGGTGTAEAVLITGGSCVSEGTTGTIAFTTANTHTGSWTIGSATVGVMEAQYALPSSGGEIIVKSGSYTLRAPIVKLAKTVWVRGQGSSTKIAVDTAFSLAHNGIIQVNDTGFSGGQYNTSGGFEDFELSCTQPDSTSIGSYTQWPPAFYMTAFYKPEINRITLKRCWGGIKAFTGSGFVSRQFWFGGFGKAFDLDDITDSVRIEGPHGWPVGATTNQVTAFIADADYFYYLGKLDDTHISNGASITGKCANIHQGIVGSGAGLDGFIVFENTDCDSNGGFEVDGSRVRINNGFFSIGYGAASRLAQPAITQTGGSIIMTGTEIYQSGTSTGPAVSLNFQRSLDINSLTVGITGDGLPSFTFIGGKIFQNPSTSIDQHCLVATTSGGYVGQTTVILEGVHFTRPATTSPTLATVKISDGSGSVRLTAIGLSTDTKTSGTGNFYDISNDGEHMVLGLRAVGWTNSLPSSITRGYYHGLMITATNTERNVIRTFGASATLNYGTPGGVPGCLTNTITVTGAVGGDVVTVGVPSTLAANVSVTAFVSSANTVTVSLCQLSGSAADLDGAGGTYKALVQRQ